MSFVKECEKEFKRIVPVLKQLEDLGYKIEFEMDNEDFYNNEKHVFRPKFRFRGYLELGEYDK